MLRKRVQRPLALAGAGTTLVAASLAVAQGESEDPAESRSAAFQAVEGTPKEDIPGGPLVVAAYGIILVLLIAYVARLGALYARNRGEVERLARALERGRKD